MIKFLIFIILFYSGFAFSQNQCSDVYLKDKFLKLHKNIEEQYLSTIGYSFGKQESFFTSSSSLNKDLYFKIKDYGHSVRDKAFTSSFASTKLSGDLENLSRTQVEKITNAYMFIDLPHVINDLYKVSIGKISIKNFQLSYGNEPFKNFLSTRKYLKKTAPPYNTKTFLDIHKRYMKGNIDGISTRDAGRFREDSVYFSLYSEDALPKSTLDILLKENPYLTLGKSKTNSKGLIYGEVNYPALETLNPRLLKKIKTQDTQLATELREFQSINKKLNFLKQQQHKKISATRRKKLKEGINRLQQEYDEYVNEILKYNKKITESLTNENISWFVKAKRKLGNLDSLDKLKKFSNLVSEYQRNMISIHPFVDGNGRSVREFSLYYAFESEGIIAPRVFFPDGDILLPLKKYQSMIWDGLIANIRLKDDLLYRLKNNLSFNNSGHIFLPPTSKPLQISKKTTGSIKRSPSQRFTYLPGDYFKSFVNYSIKENRSLIKKLENNFYEAYSGLNKKAIKQYLNDHIIYNHKKRGIENVALEPVTDDFISFYKKTSFATPKVYQEKIRRYYEKDKIIWRGLADTERIPTESDLLDHFRIFNFHMASNEVMNITTSYRQSAIINSAIKDFKRYNNDLFSNEGRLVRMARDHSETGPLYDSSYGYSTSKDKKVGKAFAMGAMVIADYGKQMGFQHLLRSRVLVGQMKSIKDVDLTTLKQVRPDFSYSYGRQQEVMGIGVADPDAIMIVQTFDSKGDVLQTYLRDINEPNIIRIISGDAKVGDTISEERIEKTIKLVMNDR